MWDPRQKNSRDRSRLKSSAVPVQFLGWCPPTVGTVARQFWGWSPCGRCPHACSSSRLRTESHSRAFLPRQQASCLTADATSHEVPGGLRLWFSSRVARSRRQDGVSRKTIRCTPSVWCQSPGEHVSDETAHTPSLGQRDLAVLQHCVRRFAVASNAEHSSV